MGGIAADKFIADLNRDTAGANHSVEKIDATAILKEVETNRAITQATFQQAVR